MAEGTELRKPIEEVLPGFGLHELPDGWRPVAAFVLVKCLDEEDEETWSYRTTMPFNLYELYGVLSVQAASVRRTLLGQWRGDPEEDDDARP